MAFQRLTSREYTVVGIVGVITAGVWATFGHLGMAIGLAIVAAGMFWRARKSRASSRGAA